MEVEEPQLQTTLLIENTIDSNKNDQDETLALINNAKSSILTLSPLVSQSFNERYTDALNTLALIPDRVYQQILNDRNVIDSTLQLAQQEHSAAESVALLCAQGRGEVAENQLALITQGGSLSDEAGQRELLVQQLGNREVELDQALLTNQSLARDLQLARAELMTKDESLNQALALAERTKNTNLADLEQAARLEIERVRQEAERVRQEKEQLEAQVNTQQLTLGDRETMIEQLTLQTQNNEQALVKFNQQVEDQRRECERQSQALVLASQNAERNARSQLEENQRLAALQKAQYEASLRDVSNQLALVNTRREADLNELTVFNKERSELDRLLERERQKMRDAQANHELEVLRLSEANRQLALANQSVEQRNTLLKEHSERLREDLALVRSESGEAQENQLVIRSEEMQRMNEERALLEERILEAASQLALSQQSDRDKERALALLRQEQDVNESEKRLIQEQLIQTRTDLQEAKRRADEQENAAREANRQLAKITTDTNSVEDRLVVAQRDINRCDALTLAAQDEKRRIEEKLFTVQGELAVLREEARLQRAQNPGEAANQLAIVSAQTQLQSAQNRVKNLENEVAQLRQQTGQRREEENRLVVRERSEAQLLSFSQATNATLTQENQRLAGDLERLRNNVSQIRLYRYDRLSNTFMEEPASSFSTQRELLLFPLDVRDLLGQAIQLRQRVGTMMLFKNQSYQNLLIQDPRLAREYVVLERGDLERIRATCNLVQQRGALVVQRQFDRPRRDLGLGAPVDALTHLGVLRQEMLHSQLNALQKTPTEYTMHVHFSTGDPQLDLVDQLSFTQRNVHRLQEPDTVGHVPEEEAERFFVVDLTNQESAANRHVISQGTLTQNVIYGRGFLNISITDRTGERVKDKTIMYDLGDNEHEREYMTQVSLSPDPDIQFYARDLGDGTYRLESILVRVD